MFIEVLILAIILGYIFKGNLRNLENTQVKGLHLIFIAFFIEFIIIMSIKNSILQAGKLTFVLDLIMYILLFTFIFINRKSPFLLLMGLGFLLNSIPIFLNGGAMPVSTAAATTAHITLNVKSEGLYTLLGEGTKAAFLSDIIPLTFPRHFVISIGDIISAIGLILFIITGMKNKDKVDARY